MPARKKVAVVIASESGGSIYKPYKNASRPYTCAATVGHLLENIQSPVELVVVSYHGGNDNDYKLLETKYANHSKLKLLRQSEVKSQIRHTQCALEVVHSESGFTHVLICDDDDFISPNISQAIARLDNNNIIKLHKFPIFPIDATMLVTRDELYLKTNDYNSIYNNAICVFENNKIHSENRNPVRWDWCGSLWEIDHLEDCINIVSNHPISLDNPVADCAVRAASASQYTIVLPEDVTGSSPNFMITDLWRLRGKYTFY